MSFEVTTRVLIDRIRAAWVSKIFRLIVSESELRNDVYGSVFSDFYMDYEVIGSPALYLNTEAHFQGKDETQRWHHSTWKLIAPREKDAALDRVFFEMSEMYEGLCDHLLGKDDSSWDSADIFHQEAIAKACRELTSSVRNKCNPNFVAMILESQGGYDAEALLNASVDSVILKELSI